MDHEPSHQPTSIPTYKWPEFFESIAQVQLGKDVRVDQGGDALLLQPTSEPLPLRQLEFAHSHRKNHLTITAGREDEVRREITIEPNLVWAVYDSGGHVVAVEIIDQHDRKVVLHFENSGA